MSDMLQIGLKLTDEEFFQHLYDLFSYTSGAEDTYWDYHEAHNGGWQIHSVNQEGERTFVGAFDTEFDADFVTAIHGSLPDLVRRLEAMVSSGYWYRCRW